MPTPDFTGAVEAMKDKLTDVWTTTPVLLQNDAPPTPWPPLDNAGKQTAWVLLEVIGNIAGLRGAGSPGNQLFLYEGHILAHVFVPTMTGNETANAHAVAIGEIYREKTFYRDESAGTQIRTLAPSIDGGAQQANAFGNWFRVTMTVPFEFYYRA